MKTQIAPTPILYGEDAKTVLEELKNNKPTEETIRKGRLLVEYFKTIENKNINKCDEMVE
ncbi:MAG: hypothetical protein ACRCX8_18875 [Sarcina sp.]